MIRRLRSSRELEEATRERKDFMWLLEGRTIDHSTFALFRVAFAKELKGLHRQVALALVRRASGPGDGLLDLVLDGTRVRANSDRTGARTAEGLERLVAACAQELDRKLEQLGAEDRREEMQSQTVQELREQVARLEAQLEQYERALEEARQRDGVRREIWGAQTSAVRVPVSDPDATVMPNKEGGFAPNYTPTVAVESASGAIVSCDVVRRFVLRGLAKVRTEWMWICTGYNLKKWLRLEVECARRTSAAA